MIDPRAIQSNVDTVTIPKTEFSWLGRWELRERLNGVAQDLVSLPMGYVAVKNRDTRVSVSIGDSAQNELDWFASNLPEFDTNTKVHQTSLPAAPSRACAFIHVRNSVFLGAITRQADKYSACTQVSSVALINQLDSFFTEHTDQVGAPGHVPARAAAQKPGTTSHRPGYTNRPRTAPHDRRAAPPSHTEWMVCQGRTRPS